jgi:hypothetical protein
MAKAGNKSPSEACFIAKTGISAAGCTFNRERHRAMLPGASFHYERAATSADFHDTSRKDS